MVMTAAAVASFQNSRTSAVDGSNCEMYKTCVHATTCDIMLEYSKVERERLFPVRNPMKCT
ncbi:hypothetical protein SK128_020476 [Halocaridina rubra]|uniref:Uncharacterized protein n=1 Tax=Halocaridina rubra TaxID=373956 RepID=A0AAN8XLH7_HALRR